MSQFIPQEASLTSLHSKVIVLTGGANGIGASTVRLLHTLGAYTVFGDCDVINAEKLVSELDHPPAKTTFIKTDATSYSDNLTLFKAALSQHGRIDHAISIAGIGESGTWISSALSITDIESVPLSRTLDVNLLGPCYFTRIASAYLSQTGTQGSDRSITLLSSIAGLKDAPHVPIYNASKHGVLGLMRSLRSHLPATHGIRINAICPWMTDTALTARIRHRWQEENLPWNEVWEVAVVIVNTLRSEGMNGKTVYVEGGRAWEIQENLDRLEPQWLGEHQSREQVRGNEVYEDWRKNLIHERHLSAESSTPNLHPQQREGADHTHLPIAISPTRTSSLVEAVGEMM